MKAIKDTEEKLKAAKEIYKRNFVKSLCKNNKEINPDDQVHLHVERKSEKETRHKLYPIFEGPFPVTKIDNQSKTVVVERPECTQENLSCDNAVLETKNKTKRDLMTEAQPMKLT